MLVSWLGAQMAKQSGIVVLEVVVVAADCGRVQGSSLPFGSVFFKCLANTEGSLSRTKLVLMERKKKTLFTLSGRIRSKLEA